MYFRILPKPFVSFVAFLATVVCMGLPLPGQQADEHLEVFPPAIHLTGESAAAGFLVQAVSEGTVGHSLGAEDVSLRIEDPTIAKLENGQVIGLKNGQTWLEISEKQSPNPGKRIPIQVVDAEKPPRWQFDAHVQAILSRHSCNSGGCHGALSGKGGFRLSLQAYDNIADHFTITRQDRGRRIEPADPGRSLLLTKPTMAIPHKGGKRLVVGSRDYSILADWISSGSPGPQPEDAELTSIEVLPNTMQLAAGETQQLIVRAKYADGRVEDVTDWAKFSSANEAVAVVDETGKISVLDSGKGTIVVWFASRIANSAIVVPHTKQNIVSQPADFQPANLIDEILLGEWQLLGLQPSPACDDATYLRRAYLDTTGSLPSRDEVVDFLQQSGLEKRNKLIDDLLSSEAYVDYWSYQWSDLMLINGTLLRPDAVAAFYKWIREQVKSNTPWDEFARQIVLARGESTEQGATNFYALHQDPESLTENTCQAFMGLSIGCAKCHNHPLEKWTNDQYYAMANLYSRVRAKGWGGDSRNGDGKRTLVVLERGDIIQPSRGKPQPPAPLDEPPIDIDSPKDRREALADWLTSDRNRYFSRSIANRVWANFMGVGLVESVDDLRISNPASSERLLDALADYLIENDYDLKSLMRLILSSQTYSRSSVAVAGNAKDQRFYCRYYPKRLMAEVLHDGIVAVTGVPSKFDEIVFPGADTKETDFYDEGTRSIELYDSAVANYFLKTFGRHQRRITCVCERSDQPTVVQALHLNNGDTINDKLKSDQCVITKWIAAEKADEDIISEAYLSALSRYPTEDEASRIKAAIQEADQDGAARREVLEDFLWSLMTSKEFLFSH